MLHPVFSRDQWFYSVTLFLLSESNLFLNGYVWDTRRSNVFLQQSDSSLNNKGHGSHIGVPNKWWSKLFCSGTPRWRPWLQVHTFYREQRGPTPITKSCKINHWTFLQFKICVIIIMFPKGASLAVTIFNQTIYCT